MAEQREFLAFFIEAHEEMRLPALLIPPLRKIFFGLGIADRLSDLARRDLRVLKSFASNFKSKLSVADGAAAGRTIRVLSVVDAFTRECLALEVHRSCQPSSHPCAG